MDIMFYALFAVVWVFIATIVIGVLAHKKTQSPKLLTALGFVLSFIPILGAILIIALIFKEPLATPKPA